MNPGSESAGKPVSPWKPSSLAELSDSDLASHLYVVVEEMIDGVVGLLVSEWPGRDRDGGLRFHFDAIEVELGVDREELEARLSARKVPEPTAAAVDGQEAERELKERPIAVGDTFAVRPSQTPESPEAIPDLVAEIGIGAWIESAIDITADARDEAKSAMYKALTPPVKDEVAEALLGARKEVELNT
ncbi:MAG TPA: hypothetical protein VIY71_10520 [Solirubrobacterales bacterium]